MRSGVDGPNAAGGWGSGNERSIPVAEAAALRPSNAFAVFEKEAVEQSIPSRFEQQVARCPGRLAVKAGRHALTYSESRKWLLA